MAGKLTLEQRIARLERLLSTNKSVKNEGGRGWTHDLDDDISNFVTGYVQEVLADESRWEQDERDDGASSSKEFERAFKRLAANRAPEMIDEIMEACADELDMDERELRRYRRAIAAQAAVEAEGVLETYYEYLPESMDRSCGRRCESRTPKYRRKR